MIWTVGLSTLSASGAVDVTEGRDATQRVVDRLERCKHRAVQQGEVQGDALGSEQSPASLQSEWYINWEQSCRKRLRCSSYWKAQHEPAMWTCSPESQMYSGLHQKKRDQQVKQGGSPALFHPSLRPHLDYCVQPWRPQQRDVDMSEQELKRATEMTRGMKQFCCEERLRELGLFSLKRTIPSST